MAKKPDPVPPDVPAVKPANVVRQSAESLGILAHYSALPCVEGGGLMTTIDLSIPTNMVRLQNILAGAGTSLWDLPADRRICIVDVTAHFATRVDEETGEEVSGPMITLSGPDGVFHTGSQYAFRALQLIGYCRGAPPWHPPVTISAVRERSRNKREFQSILLCPD